MFPKRKLPQHHQDLFQHFPAYQRLFFLIEAIFFVKKHHLPSISTQRLFTIATTFSPAALATLFRHLAQILPPLTVFLAALAVYTPETLITFLNVITTLLLTASAAFSLAFFHRRRQAWAPRIFSPIPWAALRLSAIAVFVANLILSLPPNLFAFFLSVFSLTVALVLMHYSTLILAADIFAPRRIHTT